MERDGLVERRVTASIPPRVDYELTALGTTLIEPMTALRHWAQDNMQGGTRIPRRATTPPH